jgi:hypothetical protein
MATTQGYETETCTRCAGSGHYSSCASYGTTCFKCRGKGNTYSKRGEAALAYARDLRTVPVEQVAVGWLIYMQDALGLYKSGWYPVLSAGFEEDGSKYGVKAEDGIETFLPYFTIKTRVCSLGLIPNESTVQAVPCESLLTEIREQAIRYQETLTKAGKPSRKLTGQAVCA